MATIIITGGTGLIGRSLTDLLIEKGHNVIIMTRNARQGHQTNISFAAWNIEEQTIEAAAIEKADYIVHLAGASVAEKRWTAERKKEILESRTRSGKLLHKALAETPNKVKAVISASAIGWYGDDKKRSPNRKAFTEDQPADGEFLGRTCKEWEESVSGIAELGIRLVKLRIGIVFSKDGGALPEFAKPVKLGVAAILGNGRQVISWIHIADLCRLFLFTIENSGVKGVYNAVAPSPISNKELTLLLAEKIKGRFFVPMHVPVFALKIRLGEMSVEVLKSANVSSEKIRSAGFTFLYPSARAAVDDLLN